MSELGLSQVHVMLNMIFVKTKYKILYKKNSHTGATSELIELPVHLICIPRGPAHGSHYSGSLISVRVHESIQLLETHKSRGA